MPQKPQAKRGLLYRRARNRPRLGPYPYTVPRVRVMRSFLLKPADFLRMQQMGLNELIHSLEEGQYKAEIDSLATRYHGAELLELALSANLARTLNKLLLISHKRELKFVISTYASKWVLQNLKTILRARMNHLSTAEALAAIVPITPTTAEYCTKLLEADDHALARALHELAGIEPAAARALLAAKNLHALEDRLDRAYYERLNNLTHQVRASKKDPLKEFFHLTVDLMNLKNLLRLKAAKADTAKIRATLVLDPEMNLKYRRMWDRLFHASPPELRKAAKGTRFAGLLAAADPTDLPGFERSIEKYLLAYSFRLLRRRPLSISPIFGFLLNKELEVRNIRLLLHGKALGLPEAFVTQNLVLPQKELVREEPAGSVRLVGGGTV